MHTAWCITHSLNDITGTASLPALADTICQFQTIKCAIHCRVLNMLQSKQYSQVSGMQAAKWGDDL